MTEIRGLLKDETVEAWKLAADLLEVLAFLPHFGGPHGMVIEGFAPPDYTQNPSVEAFADEWGMYRTAINLVLYRTYDEERFREAVGPRT